MDPTRPQQDQQQHSTATSAHPSADVTLPASPEAAADLLRGGSVTPAPSYNQRVTLYYQNGLFILGWLAAYAAPYDWVGLYSSINAKDTDYITGAWQWAVNGSPFTTLQNVIPGYQARYLVWNYVAEVYVSVAKTDPFPDIRICS